MCSDGSFVYIPKGVRYLGEKVVELSLYFKDWMDDYKIDNLLALLEVKNSDCDEKLKQTIDDYLERLFV